MEDCKCIEWKWSKRQIKGGSYQWGQQCQLCGSLKVMKKSQVNMDMVTDYDETIKKSYQDAQEKEWANQVSVAEGIRNKEHQDFLNDHNEYLKTEHWLRLREQVLERDKGVCQGCGYEVATQVHHKTYRNHKAEFLFQLISLCKQCHSRYHGRELN